MLPEFLKSAEFWCKVGEAKQLHAEGELVQALAELEEAMKISRREAYHARALMGDIVLEQGTRAEYTDYRIGDLVERNVFTHNIRI